MTKYTSGPVYKAVTKKLQDLGHPTDGIEIVNLGRNLSRQNERLILQDGEVIGEYYTGSEKMILYPIKLPN